MKQNIDKLRAMKTIKTAKREFDKAQLLKCFHIKMKLRL